MESSTANSSFAKWKPVEIMLAVLFLVAPFYYHPNIGGEGFLIPNNITIWMVATVTIVYSLYLVLKRSTFVIPKYFIYIAALPILITLSGFVTGVEQPITWLFRLLFIWGGLAFFFSLFQHQLKRARLDRILLMIVISALVHGLLGVAQIKLQMDMPFWLPKSPDGVARGVFQQINIQASYQVTAIMISAYLITRPFIAQGQTCKKILVITTLACAGFLVMVSGSRIGALTLILGLMIIIPTLWQQFARYKSLSLIAIVTLLMGIGIGYLKSDNQVIDKTIAMQSGYSGSARLGIYGISLELIKERPIFGHGIGSFPRVWQYAKSDFYELNKDTEIPSRFVTHPHNEFLFWLVEAGLIAIIGLLGVILGIILALKQLGWRRGGAYTAMLLPIGLHTQVELPFYVSALHWFLFIFLIVIATSYSVRRVPKVMTNALIRLSNIVLIVLFLVMTVFYIHTIRSHWDFIAYYKGEQMQTPFPYAFKNPYLSDQAQWIDMNTILNSNIQQNVNNDASVQQQINNTVEVYVSWGEQRLLNKPNIQLFNKLADAYFYLGDMTGFCFTINRALAMYPEKDNFRKALVHCGK